VAFVFPRRRRGFGVPHDEALQEAIDAAEASAGGNRPAPFAAAQVAQRLKWPFALPLLAAALFAGAGRGAAGDGADGAEGAIVFVYAKAAARACDLSAELGRRAQKLQHAAPKLRAKEAGATLEALVDKDSLSASSKISGQISERGARRLFDRLVALEALRELTGRATFRLYGL
jgi:Protein of unknown function (DUF1403)